MVSSFLPHIIATAGSLFVSSVPSEEHSIKKVIEEYLKRESWKINKQTEETGKNAI